MAPSTRVELKPADVAERRNFKARNGPQGLSFWKKLVYIDGHTVKKVSSLRAAAHVAKSRCRGQYRRKVNNRVMKTGLLPKCHGRISKKLRFNTGGAFKFIVACSYEKGVFFMHRVSSPGSWTATAAAEMYKGLRRAVGHDRQVALLEDNDPVWKTASVGRVKSSLRFRTLPGGFPRRSPDLNPLDFAINAEIDRRALRSFRRNRGRRVSNKEFIEGVERIAMGNSMKAFVRKCIASMPGRVNRFDVNEVSRPARGVAALRRVADDSPSLPARVPAAPHPEILIVTLRPDASLGEGRAPPSPAPFRPQKASLFAENADGNPSY